MNARLYVVHGSHPCATVERALELKGIPYRTVELPPAMHAPIQRVMFGRRTVPGLRLNGERISGSRAIVARLEQLQPDPPLFPPDPAARARVEEAERWGDDTFQPIARRVLWFALRRNPQAALSYSEHSRLPMPAPMVRASMPLIARAEFALNQITDDAVGADLEALPGYLNRIDGWIGEGVIGGEQPNAADLQIASTLRLLMTLEDVRPLIERRPAGRLTLRLFPERDGRMPSGSLPAAWLPEPAATAG
jgi:glutathione S-transferase